MFAEGVRPRKMAARQNDANIRNNLIQKLLGGGGGSVILLRKLKRKGLQMKAKLIEHSECQNKIRENLFISMR